MGRKKSSDDDEPSVIDLINNAFHFGHDDVEETPLERYRRTGKKLPPPNNPTTPEGRKWIKENLKPVVRTSRKKKRPR